MACYGDLYGTSYQYTISGNLSVDQSMIYILKTNSNGISLVPFEPGSQNSSNSIYNLPSQSINTNTQNDSKYKCGYCNSTGKCPYCKSAGQSKACVQNQFGANCTDSYCIAKNHKCKHCDGTHICSRCKGNGYK